MKFLISVLLLLSFLFPGAALATFAIFQTYYVPPVPQATCNIQTGAVAGGPTGPCVNPTAACDGVTNNAASFVSFGNWAIANQANYQLILDLPASATCVFEPSSSQSFWLGGSANAGNPTSISAVATGGTCGVGGSTCVRLTVGSTTGFVTGTTADIAGTIGTPLAIGTQTITVVDGTHIDLPNATFVANTLDSLPRVYGQKSVSNLIVRGNGATIKNTTSGTIQTGPGGMIQDNRHYGKVATVSAGASSVTLSDLTKIRLFTVGSYALMTGFDLQGVWQSPFGFPPNLHFFEFVLISGVNPATGVITFSAPLVNGYKSTWPEYNSGSLFETYPGGPATLYYLGPGFSTTVEYQNLTFDQVNQQSASAGKSITWRGVTMTGANCAPPTQNITWQFISSFGVNCSFEADKMVHSVTVTDSTIKTFKFQSSSINTLTMSGSSITNDLTGTPKTATITNSTLATFHPGAYAYGNSTGAITCTNCVITNLQTGGYVNAGTNSAVGFNNVTSMSGGIIQYPNGVNITNVADNGSGNPRLTVSSTTGFTTGQLVNVGSVTGSTGVNGGNASITVVDGTHFDLLSNTLGGSYTGGGVVGNYAPGWAVPGAYLYWSGSNGVGGLFKIIDVTQDVTNTYVQTDQAGGFPSIPSTGNKLSIITLGTPSMTCTGCSGSPEALDLAAAPAAGLPIYSYASRQITGASGASAILPRIQMYGNMTAIHFNVTNAYSGAGVLTFKLSQFDNWQILNSANAEVSWNSAGGGGPQVNAKSVGDRQITLSGVTCPTGSCTGDTGLTLPDATKSWFQGASLSSPIFSADVSASCPGANCPAITLTMQTNQGVVYP